MNDERENEPLNAGGDEGASGSGAENTQPQPEGAASSEPASRDESAESTESYEKLEFADDEPENAPPEHMLVGAAAGAGAGRESVTSSPSNAVLSTQTSSKSDKKSKGFVGHSFDFVIELAKILMIVLLLRAYVVQASSVEGHSMEGTLWDQDLLLVERFSMSLVNGPEWLKSIVPESIMPELERGDIVVLTSPENGNNELVKRVLAVSGDTLFFYDGRVWVNGQAVEEGYLSDEIIKGLGKNDEGGPNHYSYNDIDDMPSQFRLDEDEYLDAVEQGTLDKAGVIVPKDCVFVMGDNRRPKQSNDSRAWASIDVNNGPEINEEGGEKSDFLWVTTKSIHGRVVARLLPPWEYDDAHPLFPN